jgi:branched-chain amino acid transport system substrate-binding protein
MSVMTRKKILVVLFFALMMVVVLVSCTRDKEILIGFAGQLTGVYSDLGVQGRNGAALALEEINAGGGVAGKRLRLIPEDDGNTPEKARQAVRKLNQQDVAAIVGHMTSGQSLAGLPVAEEAGVVMLSPTTSTPALTGKKDMFFRIQPSTVYTAESLGRFVAEKLNLPQVSTVRDLDNDAYTAPFHQHFIYHFEQSGGRIAANCTFSSQDSGNWSEVLACLQLENIPGVLIIASARDVVSIIQAMGASGTDLVLLSSGWGATRELLSQGGRTVDGLYLAKTGFMHDPDSTYSDFERRYQNRFGRAPSFAAVQGYDAIKLLARALRQTGGDSRGLPRALTDITDFPSFYGTLRLDSFGDAHLPVRILQVRNGQFEHQWTAEPENENTK